MAGGQHLTTSIAILLLGVIAAVVFVRRELTQSTPILPVDLLANRVVALSIVSAQFAFIASMTFVLSLPFRLQERFGFSPSEVGTAVAPFYWHGNRNRRDAATRPATRGCHAS
jgi:DHA2 family multidrug resistance protein-like MFS transporter